MNPIRAAGALARRMVLPAAPLLAVLLAYELVQQLAPAHATTPEKLWTGNSGVFSILTLTAWGYAVYDLARIYRDRTNGVIRRTARGNLRGQTVSAAIQGTMLGIGVYALSTPPVNPATPTPTYSIVVSAGLIAIQWMIGLNSVLDLLDRRWIDRYVEPDLVQTAQKAAEVSSEINDIVARREQ